MTHPGSRIPRLTDDHLARLAATVCAQHPDRPAMRVMTAEEEQVLTYAEVGDQVHAIAQVLVREGVQPGDRVAILSANCPAWSLVDLAILAVRAIGVPVYPTSTPAQARLVLDDCSAVMAFAGDARLLDILRSIRPDLPHLRALACFDPEVAGDDLVGTWDELLAVDEPMLRDEVRSRTSSASGEEVATVIYTSGTTSRPKGVALSHRTLIHQIQAVDAFFDFGPDDSSLAFLPLSHAFERAWTFFVLSHGALNTYVRDPKTVAEQMRLARPTALVAVPKLYEAVYSTAHAMASRTRLRRTIFDWALSVGTEVGRRRLEGRTIPRGLRVRLRVADRLVLHNIRDAVGGPKTVMAAGGAPLRKEVEEFFWAGGLLVCQGYGMTETGPLMTFNSPGAVRFGTVGRVIEGGEMRVGDEGELMYRGPNLMEGYWGDPGATADTIVDGWLRTGDIGEIDDDGFVTITDRLKDLVVTLQGKNIAPAPIEARIAEHPAVEHAVVIGDRRPCLVALVQLVPDAPANALDDVRSHVAGLDGELAPAERIRAVDVVDTPLTIESGTLTPTLKVRRKAVEEACAQTLDRMYDELRAAREPAR